MSVRAEPTSCQNDGLSTQFFHISSLVVESNSSDVIVPSYQANDGCLSSNIQLLRIAFLVIVEVLFENTNDGNSDRERFSFLWNWQPKSIEASLKIKSWNCQCVRGTECPPQRLIALKSTPFSIRNSMAGAELWT